MDCFVSTFVRLLWKILDPNRPAVLTAIYTLASRGSRARDRDRTTWTLPSSHVRTIHILRKLCMQYDARSRFCLGPACAVQRASRAHRRLFYIYFLVVHVPRCSSVCSCIKLAALAKTNQASFQQLVPLAQLTYRPCLASRRYGCRAAHRVEQWATRGNHGSIGTCIVQRCRDTERRRRWVI